MARSCCILPIIDPPPEGTIAVENQVPEGTTCNPFTFPPVPDEPDIFIGGGTANHHEEDDPPPDDPPPPPPPFDVDPDVGHGGEGVPGEGGTGIGDDIVPEEEEEDDGRGAVTTGSGSTGKPPTPEKDPPKDDPIISGGGGGHGADTGIPDHGTTDDDDDKGPPKTRKGPVTGKGGISPEVVDPPPEPPVPENGGPPKKGPPLTAGWPVGHPLSAGGSSGGSSNENFVFVPTGSNTPARPVTKVKTRRVESLKTGNNTPNFPSSRSKLTAPQIANSINANSPSHPAGYTMEAPKVDNSPIFADPNPIFKVYDRQYNYDIETNESILKLATVQEYTNTHEDPHRIFKNITNRSLNSILNTQGGTSLLSKFNATTLGSYLYNKTFIENALNTSVKKSLDTISTFNITSFHTATYLKEALRKAVANGTVKDYSTDFFEEIQKSGFRVFNNGVPQVPAFFGKREKAYELIEKEKIIVAPFSYSNSVVQRKVQMLYFNPKDIDLTVKVVASDGQSTGVRVNSNGNINITKLDGTVEQVKQQNEFLEIPYRRGSQIIHYRKAPLNSNRYKSYMLSPPNLSMIQGLLGEASPTQGASVKEYGVNLSFSGINTSLENNVEVSGYGETLPEAILFSLMKDTITELPSSNPDLRKTQVTYKMAWKSGDDLSNFNDTVQYHSGPRDSYYIVGDDPIASYIMETDSVSVTERYATVTFTDLKTTIQDIVLPRRILTDFIIYFTDVVKYIPFQGQSTLDTYEAGEPLKRSINMINSPFLDVQKEGYAETSAAVGGRNIAGNKDLLAVDFVKSFTDGDKLNRLSKSKTNFTSTQSSFGKAIHTVSSISTNYDLATVGGTYSLPSNDLYSFFTFKDFVNFIKVSKSLRTSLFSGSFSSNSVTLFPVKTSDTEKTFLTASRLKEGMSDSIVDTQVQKTVPKVGYFPNRITNAEFEGGG